MGSRPVRLIRGKYDCTPRIQCSSQVSVCCCGKKARPLFRSREQTCFAKPLDADPRSRAATMGCTLPAETHPLTNVADPSHWGRASRVTRQVALKSNYIDARIARKLRVPNVGWKMKCC